MNEEFTLYDLKKHQEDDDPVNCKVCKFIKCLTRNMEDTQVPKIWLYVASRDHYYR